MSFSPDNLPYRLGCPIWNSKAWLGTLYESRGGPFLTQYSRTFGTVEGNSTFYGLPSEEVIQRWCEEAGGDFHFCLKFPREVTHERLLVGAARETCRFLDLANLLDSADRLGPMLLQLSPHFDSTRFEDLRAFLADLEGYPIAVEVRHLDWFDEGRSSDRLDDLLAFRGMDRVMFDSRALYSAPATTESERVSQGRKPNLPLHVMCTGNRPMVRFIGRDDLETLEPWITEWSARIAGWVFEGKEPYVFAHTPDDSFAPAFAIAIHNEVRRRLPDLPEIPWPAVSASSQQRELFAD